MTTSSLSIHSRVLADQQRKEILQGNLTLLKEFDERPKLCVDVAMTGGRGLSQEQLSSAKDAFSNTLIATVENLIEESQTASQGLQDAAPISEDHFTTLGDKLVESGLSDDQLQALIDEDPSHPEFCTATIGLMEVLIDLDRLAGEVFLFEMTREILTASP